ncbi:MAG: sigma-70 family RNA polymerase sigma factor [Propionibacteriaceae bacterium]|nr:sigma-70 family RNA polymerase sigma factor [Propionibacteriaceae bacterium]
MATEEAFEAFFRANWVPVVQFVQRRISDPWAAEDVAQDCFVAAVRRFDPEAPPSLAWLYGVAWNQVKKHYGRRSREAGLLTVLAAERPSDLREQTAKLVADVLAALSEAEREVLVLTYWDGLSAADIGLILGISESAVWQRLSRARRAAERLLERSTSEGARSD